MIKFNPIKSVFFSDFVAYNLTDIRLEDNDTNKNTDVVGCNLLVPISEGENKKQ